MKYSELTKRLRKAGCVVYREGKGHTMWKNPLTGVLFPVPRHRTEEVPAGTLKKIMKSAGLE